MPNRILKESVCVSETIDELSWFEEVFFYRLIVNCDDYGRYDARPAVLKGRLFPLKDVTVKQVEDALHKLSTVGIATLYTVDDRPYLQLTTWGKHQQTRATKSKFPPFDGTCNQLISDDIGCSRNRNRESIHDNRETKKTGADEIERELESRELSESVKGSVKEWLAYKEEKRQGYKPTGLKALLTQVQNKVKKYGEEPVASLIRECMANGWQGIIWEKLEKQQPAKPGFPPKDYTIKEEGPW